jgi:hypothetical protein
MCRLVTLRDVLGLEVDIHEWHSTQLTASPVYSLTTAEAWAELLPSIHHAKTSAPTISTAEGCITDLKNGVFRDITPCGSCENRLFGGT